LGTSSATSQAAYTSPYAPTPAEGAGRPADGPPLGYQLQKLYNVSDIWREWKYGIAGSPAVEALEEKWGHRWRPGTKARVAFSRRKVIWDEVRSLLRDGMTEEAAVQKLEHLRAGRSINKLQEMIQGRHGNGPGTGRKRKAPGDGGA
jgi:hypothetical protein